MVDTDELCMGCMSEIGLNNKCPHCGYSNTEEDIIFGLPNKTILKKQYLIGKVLGYGGFGITYLAWDLQLNVKLAIKEYLPRIYATRSKGQTSVSIHSKDVQEIYANGKEKFLEEARILAGLNHCPNIVSIKDFFEENDTAYIVMYYIEGITLKDYLSEQGGRLPVNEAIEIMKPVVQSLSTIHKEGILHRDISPDNIYITNTGQVKLLDFGASKEYISDKSMSMSVVLKHGYGPPEQYFRDGLQGPWTDVYSVSATLYRLLTGEIPPESLSRYRTDEIKSLDAFQLQLPAYVKDSIMKGLALEVEDRHATMNDFYNVLYNKPKDKSSLSLKTKKVMKKSMVMIGAIIISTFILYNVVVEPVKVTTSQNEINEEESLSNDGMTNSQSISTVMEDQDYIVFPDSGLERLIREIIQKPNGEIYYRDVKDITIIDSNESIDFRISSIEGLQHFTNLEELKLARNSITDIGPIENLTKLKAINFANNQISDISPLENLVKMEDLDVCSNKIKDLSPLGRMTKLRIMIMMGNKIEDIMPIKELIALQELRLEDNNISDITPIKNFINLEKLNISNNPIRDYTVLDEMQINSIIK